MRTTLRSGNSTTLPLARRYRLTGFLLAGILTGTAWSAAPAPNLPKVDLNNFSRPTQIDNKWFPLKPGTRLTYEGTTIEDDGSAVPHRIVINVTDLTKVISGVRTLVTWDLDYSKGRLVEKELAFYAQDNDGTVWRVGEYPEEYEEGKFVKAPAWIHGFEGAQMGIQMHANPRAGTPDYAQGWGPAVDWTDRAKVDQLGAKSDVPAGPFQDVLVTAETSASEPDAQQLKHHAPGIGVVQVTWRGAGEKTKETLGLVRVESLDAKAMEQVRRESLVMERDGKRRSKKVYALTPPLEQEVMTDGQATYVAALTASKPAIQPAAAKRPDRRKAAASPKSRPKAQRRSWWHDEDE